MVDQPMFSVAGRVARRSQLPSDRLLSVDFLPNSSVDGRWLAVIPA
jgi:hypothetical protein